MKLEQTKCRYGNDDIITPINSKMPGTANYTTENFSLYHAIEECENNDGLEGRPTCNVISRIFSGGTPGATNYNIVQYYDLNYLQTTGSGINSISCYVKKNCSNYPCNENMGLTTIDNAESVEEYDEETCCITHPFFLNLF